MKVNERKMTFPWHKTQKNTSSVLMQNAMKFLFIFSSTVACANNIPDARIEVWGTEYTNMTEYPDRGINSKLLVDKLTEARDRYPLRMTIEELNLVADSITAFYREAGFKFHSVYVPPQSPKDGLILFKTIEAKLGDIHVIGKNVDDETIKAVFVPFLNKPLYQPDIDHAVLALKDQNGIDAVAYYSRGKETGEVRLNVKVKQQTWGAYLQTDNFGSQSTGENRLTAATDWLSPSGRLDQFSMGIMAADGDANTNFFAYLNYKAPLWNLDNQLSLSISNNQFSIGEAFSNLELDGDARIAQLRFDHGVSRSWLSKQSLGISLAYKSTDYDSAFKDPALERDEISKSIELDWAFKTQNKTGRFQQQWFFSTIGGHYNIDGITDNKEDFNKINTSINLKQYLGSGESHWLNMLSLSLRGQYSKAPLPSFEKILITGAYGVRHYKPGFFAGERGALATLDWYFPRLFDFASNAQFNVTPLLFIDVAHAEKLSIDSTVFDRATISSAGLGFEMALGKSWSARLFSSKELSQKTDSGLQLDSMDFFFQINYRTHD